jgi:hypothetical protein
MKNTYITWAGILLSVAIATTAVCGDQPKYPATPGAAKDPDSNMKDLPAAGPQRRPVHPDDQGALTALKKVRASISLDDDRRIRQVVFDSPKVTNADLVHLKKVSNLRELLFYRSQITDAGMVHIKGLTKLRVLSFWRQRITDEGLLQLYGLTKLERLSVGRTGTSDEGIRKLQRALPQCKINQPSAASDERNDLHSGLEQKAANVRPDLQIGLFNKEPSRAKAVIADDLDKLADRIRPTKAEELWRTIPWCRSAEEALELARKENRAIFVWEAAGEPFVGC